MRNDQANPASEATPISTRSSLRPSKAPAYQPAQRSTFERREEDLIQQAGDQGEEWLLSRFGSSSRSKGVHLFTGKRIPDGRQRREIDLLAVTTKRLYIFEVKNWSGVLSLEGNTWVQRRQNGERRVCADPIASTLDQAYVLLRYLATKGIVVSDELVSHKVFFVNPHLDIDPAIAQHPDVISPSKLTYPANDQVIIDYCLHQDRRDPGRSRLLELEARASFPRIVGEMHQLRTWDRIFWYGGGSDKGDVKQLQIGDQVFFQNDLAPGLSIQVQWTYGESNTLLQALLGIKPGTLLLGEDQKFPISSDDGILFHKAGQSEPAMISLENIKQIVIG